MTLALTVLNYACGRVHPPWHLVHMALAGGQSDVRMAHSLDCRHARTGHRCEGRLLLPFVGHHPVQAHDRQLVIMFRRPAQRLISAFRDNYHAWGLGAEKRNAMKRSNPTVDRNPNPNLNPNPNANANPNPNPNPNPNSKQREKWYGTEYAELALPKGSLEEWSYPGVPSALSLPEENAFLPSDFRLLEQP